MVDVARQVLGGEHAGITVHRADHFVALVSTDDVAAHLDERQIVIGQGPIFSVMETGTPTVVADTEDALAQNRWPAFGPVLADAGIRSLLSFPLASGGAHVGAITSYRLTPFFPDPETYTNGLVLAALATEIVLHIEAGLATGVPDGDTERTMSDNAVIQQAVGITAEQLGIPIVDAAIRLRAHAFATDQPLTVLARRVVNGETALEP